MESLGLPVTRDWMALGFFGLPCEIVLSSDDEEDALVDMDESDVDGID